MKVFIDLGSHTGKAITRFMASSEYSPEWVIHAFDPNPYLPMAYPDCVTKHRTAAWIEEGELAFYVNAEKPTDNGASVMREKLIGHLDKEHPLVVPCIDIGAWIKKNFQNSDTIILKMDIEGAEYRVLESMLANGSLEYVDRLYVEAHSRKVLVSDEDSDALLARVGRVTDLHMDYIESSKIKKGKKRWHETHVDPQPKITMGQSQAQS